MSREKRVKWYAAAAAILLAAGASSAWADGPKHSDFEVGQDGSALHKLLVHGDPDILSGTEPIELAPLVDPFSALNGWFINPEPGWNSVEMDEPEVGLFTLLANHHVALQRISFDGGFFMFDEGENPILTSDTSSYQFASDAMGALHEDLNFAAPPLTLVGATFTATLRLIDDSGLHAAGNPISLRFVTVPEPATLALVVVSGLRMMKRRKAR